MRERHPQKELEDALVDVEVAGWRIEVRHHGHTWGRIYCPNGHAGCMKTVYSTPSDAHDHGEQLLQAVRRCQRRMEAEQR